MNDDVILQPGTNTDGDPDQGINKPISNNSTTPENESAESKIFDFSSDLNISVVKDDADKSEPVAINPFKTGGMPFITIIPQKPKVVAPTTVPTPVTAPTPVAVPTPIAIPTKIPTPTPSLNPISPSTSTPIPTPASASISTSISKQASTPTQTTPQKPKIDPFRETIGQDTEWPFASPQTIAQRKSFSKDSPNILTEKKGGSIIPGELEPPQAVKLPTADVPKGKFDYNPSIKSSNTPNQAPAMMPPRPASPNPISTTVPMSAAATLASLTAQTPTVAVPAIPILRAETADPANKKPIPKSITDAHRESTIIKNLRTYEGDIAEVLANRGTSAVSVAIAENKRKGEGETLRNKPSTSPTPKPKTDVDAIFKPTQEKESNGFVSKIIIVLICIILVGIGSIAGYYLYERSPLTKQTPVVPKAKSTTSIMSSEIQRVITTDGLNGQKIMAKIKAEVAKPQTRGSIKEIVLTEVKDGAGYRVSAAEIISLLEIPVPDIISRTLNPQWMLGSYSSPQGEQSVFVIFTTNLFQNAFAGMLAWESGMPESYKNLFATSSAYTPNLIGQFKDGIIKNKDLRIFVSDNKTLFEYSFIDNSTLVFTKNDAAMGAIITRLENKAFVR